MKNCWILFIALFIFSCSKKNLPEKTVVNKSEAAKPKPVYKKGPWPKTLSVNDKIASRSVDGRLYFDFDGKRYWKNYKDGKYYLFNKSMFTNPDFKPR